MVHSQPQLGAFCKCLVCPFGLSVIPSEVPGLSSLNIGVARLPSAHLSDHLAKREFTRDRQADVLKGCPRFRASSWELTPCPCRTAAPRDVVFCSMVSWFSKSTAADLWPQTLKYLHLPGRALGELSSGRKGRGLGITALPSWQYLASSQAKISTDLKRGRVSLLEFSSIFLSCCFLLLYLCLCITCNPSARAPVSLLTLCLLEQHFAQQGSQLQQGSLGHNQDPK